MNIHPSGPSDDKRPSNQPLLDPATGVLWIGHESVKLTRAEQAIFLRLMQSPGQALSRERLYDVLYDARADSDCPDPKIIDVFICKLRRKVARIGLAGLIETLGGRGFRLVGPTPALALGLTSSEWHSLQIVVAAAERQKLTAAAIVRAAMQRLDH